MSGTKFLVTGCGSIGRRHIGNLLQLKAGTVIAHDVSSERLRDIRELYGVETCGSFQEALQTGVGAVLICNPTVAHVPTAVAALNAGCDLFVEKPLAASISGIEELRKAALKSNRLVFVGCNFRFEPRLKIAARLLREGKLGRIYSATAEFGHALQLWRPWQDYRKSYSANKSLGGGIILDSYHEFDYLYWLLGPVNTVVALSANIGSLGIDTEDVAAIAMRFDSGALCQIRLDYLRQPYVRRCSIVGELGTMEWDYGEQSLRIYDLREHTWVSFGKEHGSDGNEMYLDEMRHFLACLEGSEEPIATLEDAIHVQELVSAAKRSSEDGSVGDLRSTTALLGREEK